ncbi:MAG: HAD family hydrolase [Candidatus Sabulitectum sp.]|nr:HAD family hydrolase [Candidatus Sabulitectum sp.]
MKYKAILFDLDGTLLDYTKEQYIAVNHDEKLFNLVNSHEVQGYETTGTPSPDSPGMAQAFKKAGVQLNPVRFLNDYFHKLSLKGIPLPGALDILNKLQGEVQLAVVSNSPGEVQNPRLETAGLSGFFAHRFYSRDLGIAKPDPAILHLALKELKVTKEETLFIGDSTTSDQPAAKAAGIDFFLFKGDFRDLKLQSLLL